ncbi:phytanoyl-CoA dioxygenase family protein [Nannocystis sp. SCPEA4]|uniref:phytanoyl-CoA dioxygenase family protein n=1 Tax=Nannocystis sp. SCPEA4 TaxID=2996787 RepID=UPI002271A7B7|nr:phytanoyl-CoA dioxygenase family protein [Nannocystis sp. SCPEA4]MCY1055624.1 phytanoyl-CoA dioxygenase family protein [Nannocystis sp. SCPEA4]
MPSTSDLTAHLNTFGFVVLRGAFDPGALTAEFDRALGEGFTDAAHSNAGDAGNRFRYLPMMCEHTPVSVALAARLARIAGELLECTILPGRAKGTEYRGSTRWHRDSTSTLRSVGVACYLDPLTADTGALQVLPGSHTPAYAAAVDEYIRRADELPGLALPSAPGDAIVFDERLYHASAGGQRRRQWRIDFVADAPDGDDELRRYFAGQHPPAWDGGYDVDRFPSYGACWRALDPRWDIRLEQLGVYHLAAAEEAFARGRRPRSR